VHQNIVRFCHLGLNSSFLVVDAPVPDESSAIITSNTEENAPASEFPGTVGNLIAPVPQNHHDGAVASDAEPNSSISEAQQGIYCFFFIHSQQSTIGINTLL